MNLQFSLAQYGYSSHPDGWAAVSAHTALIIVSHKFLYKLSKKRHTYNEAVTWNMPNGTCHKSCTLIRNIFQRIRRYAHKSIPKLGG